MKGQPARSLVKTFPWLHYNTILEFTLISKPKKEQYTIANTVWRVGVVEGEEEEKNTDVLSQVQLNVMSQLQLKNPQKTEV